MPSPRSGNGRFQTGRSGNPGGRLRRGLSVSDHVTELLDRDYAELKRIHTYLEAKDEKKLGRITVARLVACRMILFSLGGSAEMTRELLNRSEGKVADKLITLDLNAEMVSMVEEARQRVLSRATRHAGQLNAHVEGEIAKTPDPQEAKALPAEVEDIKGSG
jgi:hypothetical protein